MAAVACLGDSITNGPGLPEPYPQKLCFELGPSFSVCNLGAIGQQTAATLTAWANSVDNRGFAFVPVLSGVNDVLASVSAATAFANLEDIYDGCLADSGCLPVLVTLLPCSATGDWTPTIQVQLEALNALIRDYATDNDVPLFDAYALMGQPGNVTALATIYNSGDGIHPNQAGMSFIAEQVSALILAA